MADVYETNRYYFTDEHTRFEAWLRAQLFARQCRAWAFGSRVEFKKHDDHYAVTYAVQHDATDFFRRLI